MNHKDEFVAEVRLVFTAALPPEHPQALLASTVFLFRSKKARIFAVIMPACLSFAWIRSFCLSRRRNTSVASLPGFLGLPGLCHPNISNEPFLTTLPLLPLFPRSGLLREAGILIRLNGSATRALPAASSFAFPPPSFACRPPWSAVRYHPTSTFHRKCGANTLSKTIRVWPRNRPKMMDKTHSSLPSSRINSIQRCRLPLM